MYSYKKKSPQEKYKRVMGYYIEHTFICKHCNKEFIRKVTFTDLYQKEYKFCDECLIEIKERRLYVDNIVRIQVQCDFCYSWYKIKCKASNLRKSSGEKHFCTLYCRYKYYQLRKYYCYAHCKPAIKRRGKPQRIKKR